MQWQFDEVRTRHIVTRRGTVYVRVMPDAGSEPTGKVAALWRATTHTAPIWGTEWVVSTWGPGVVELGLSEPERFPTEAQAHSRAARIEAIVRDAEG